MENPSFNLFSDPAARTGCEVSAKVPEILFGCEVYCDLILAKFGELGSEATTISQTADRRGA